MNPMISSSPAGSTSSPLLDSFLTQTHSHLSHVLNEPHLHNLIRINSQLFIISNTSEYKLYYCGGESYELVRVVEELSFVKDAQSGKIVRDKAIMYKSIVFKKRGKQYLVLKTNEGFSFFQINERQVTFLRTLDFYNT